MIEHVETLLRCHCDVRPYRDALHRRNNVCGVLLLALAVTSLMNIVFTLTGTNPSRNHDFSSVLSDTDMLRLVDMFRIDQSRILEDIKAVYPDGLEMEFAPHRQPRIEGNREWPFCFASPKFLKPFLDMEVWHNTGVSFDETCLVRIDPEPSRLLEHKDFANVEVSKRYAALCSKLAAKVMRRSLFVFDPEAGVQYMLMFNASAADRMSCSPTELQLQFQPLNRLEFEAMINPQSAEYGGAIAEAYWYFKASLIGLVSVVFAGRTAFTAMLLLFEALAAKLLVWGATSLLHCCGAFQALNPRWRAPKWFEVWRLQMLLCVPDLTFVRMLHLAAFDMYSRIGARVVLAIFLLIDAYQNDPLHV